MGSHTCSSQCTTCTTAYTARREALGICLNSGFHSLFKSPQPPSDISASVPHRLQLCPPIIIQLLQLSTSVLNLLQSLSVLSNWCSPCLCYQTGEVPVCAIKLAQSLSVLSNWCSPCLCYQTGAVPVCAIKLVQSLSIKLLQSLSKLSN